MMDYFPKMEIFTSGVSEPISLFNRLHGLLKVSLFRFGSKILQRWNLDYIDTFKDVKDFTVVVVAIIIVSV